MLTIPKGSTSGKVLRLKGRGFTAKDGKRGDQLVTRGGRPSGGRRGARRSSPKAGPAAATRARRWAFKATSACADISPQSPEARRKRHASVLAAFGPEVEKKLHPRLTAWEIIKRIAIGVYNDGFIHAGNLAYLALLALFPFFILAAAVAALFGQTQDAQLTVASILQRLPPDVASTPARADRTRCLQARTGPLLWFGALVGLWTATSFIETIRDILRRAYGVEFCAPVLGISAGLDPADPRRGAADDDRVRTQRRVELDPACGGRLVPLRRRAGDAARALSAGARR